MITKLERAELAMIMAIPRCWGNQIAMITKSGGPGEGYRWG
jgi:hypothetical protein